MTKILFIPFCLFHKLTSLFPAHLADRCLSRLTSLIFSPSLLLFPLGRPGVNRSLLHLARPPTYWAVMLSPPAVYVCVCVHLNCTWIYTGATVTGNSQNLNYLCGDFSRFKTQIPLYVNIGEERKNSCNIFCPKIEWKHMNMNLKCFKGNRDAQLW